MQQVLPWALQLFFSPHNYRDRCISSMSVLFVLCAIDGQTKGKCVCVCLKKKKRKPWVQDQVHPPTHHYNVAPPPSGLRRGCQACESATLLSRQEGNNGLAVLLVSLDAFMQHFRERHRRLLAQLALLTEPFPAGHWPVVPTVVPAASASHLYQLPQWCLDNRWSKGLSWLWNPNSICFLDLKYL